MDKFQTAGAIIAFVILVYMIIDRIRPTHHFFTSMFLPWARRRRVMFKDWGLWRRYHPDYEIHAGNITVLQKGHRIELPIKITYISRDSEADTLLRIDHVLIDMFHKGKRRKAPYRLYSHSDRYDEVIPPNGIVERDFLPHLEMPSSSPPVKLNQVAKCRVIDVGIAKVEGMHDPKRLKPIRFKVEVRHVLAPDADEAVSEKRES
ncbi:MAG: hypothetical protein IMY88_02365 [Chloroflexi bacterium]|nr:hypothetical protein [Chloroflexota bacterium]